VLQLGIWCCERQLCIWCFSIVSGVSFHSTSSGTSPSSTNNFSFVSGVSCLGVSPGCAGRIQWMHARAKHRSALYLLQRFVFRCMPQVAKRDYSRCTPAPNTRHQTRAKHRTPHPARPASASNLPTPHHSSSVSAHTSFRSDSRYNTTLNNYYKPEQNTSTKPEKGDPRRFITRSHDSIGGDTVHTLVRSKWGGARTFAA